MHITILTLLWKRQDLSRLFFEWHDRLDLPGLTLTGVAVYSARDRYFVSQIKDQYPAWSFVEHPNEPRSDKWNAGSQVAQQQYDPDALLILGSDDFMSQSYLAAAVGLVEAYDYVTGQGCYFYHPETRRLVYNTYGRLGAGRLLRRDLLRRVDWKPWLPGELHRSDAAMDKQVKPRRGFLYTDGRKTPLVDVKTDINVWDFDNVTTNATTTEWVRDVDEWFAQHFHGQDLCADLTTVVPYTGAEYLYHLSQGPMKDNLRFYRNIGRTFKNAVFVAAVEVQPGLWAATGGRVAPGQRFATQQEKKADAWAVHLLKRGWIRRDDAPEKEPVVDHKGFVPLSALEDPALFDKERKLSPDADLVLAAEDITTPEAEITAATSVELIDVKGSWYYFSDGHKAQGQAAAEEYLKTQGG